MNAAMFRLYSNEDLPQPVVNELRRRVCDVVTVLESDEQAYQILLFQSVFI